MSKIETSLSSSTKIVYRSERNTLDKMLDILENINYMAPEGETTYLRPSDVQKLDVLRQDIKLTTLAAFKIGQDATRAMAIVFQAQAAILEALAPDVEDRAKDIIVALKNAKDHPDFHVANF